MYTPFIFEATAFYFRCSGRPAPKERQCYCIIFRIPLLMMLRFRYSFMFKRHLPPIIFIILLIIAGCKGEKGSKGDVNILLYWDATHDIEDICFSDSDTQLYPIDKSGSQISATGADMGAQSGGTYSFLFAINPDPSTDATADTVDTSSDTTSDSTSDTTATGCSQLSSAFYGTVSVPENKPTDGFSNFGLPSDGKSTEDIQITVEIYKLLEEAYAVDNIMYKPETVVFTDKESTSDSTTDSTSDSTSDTTSDVTLRLSWDNDVSADLICYSTGSALKKIRSITSKKTDYSATVTATSDVYTFFYSLLPDIEDSTADCSSLTDAYQGEITITDEHRTQTAVTIGSTDTKEWVIEYPMVNFHSLTEQYFTFDSTQINLSAVNAPDDSTTDSTTDSTSDTTADASF